MKTYELGRTPELSDFESGGCCGGHSHGEDEGGCCGGKNHEGDEEHEHGGHGCACKH